MVFCIYFGYIKKTKLRFKVTKVKIRTNQDQIASVRGFKGIKLAEISLMNTQCVDIIEDLILGLKRGESLRYLLLNIIKSKKGALRNHLQIWLDYFDTKKDRTQLLEKLKYPENKSLFLILEYGLLGYPVLQSLEKLSLECVALQKIRMDLYMQTLPYKMLIPLFVFFFPALMWSFLWPFLNEFKNALGH